MIVRLKYIGFAVKNVDHTRAIFRNLLGMDSWAGGPNPHLGVEKSAWLPFPNECYLYFMQSSDPDSRVYRYLEEKGPGLERIALLTDELEADIERIKQSGIPFSKDAVAHTAIGRAITVPGEYVSGVTVELIEPNKELYAFDGLSNRGGVLGLQHIGVAVHNLEKAAKQFKELFNLDIRDMRTDQHEGEQKDAMIEPGNDRLWLHLTESWGENARVRHFLENKGPGLEHLCIEVCDIREAVVRVKEFGVPFHENKIFTNREDGFEAFIYPEYTGGVTIELIEPYPTSRGYRPK
jgi:methylmalonyl-CoA/ethylmalonyl-CoA epimerase